MAEIEQYSGIESLDCNDWFVIVKAPIQVVAPAFVQIRQATVWQQDVYDREIEIIGQDFIVFQFRGHAWTLLHRLLSRKVEPNEEDAERLARHLDTEVIYYRISDTAEFIRYRLYDSTGLVESLSHEDGSGQFYSTRRQLSAASIENPWTFADDFMSERGIYVPMVFLPEVAVGQRMLLRIETHMTHSSDPVAVGSIPPVTFKQSDFSRFDHVGIEASR
ncbi:MAG: hypothetical protein LH702_17680 [Phormidesmis sp. CAN_BIN44]|nr:hypothetical protein [Phormidesmis sp. CAN_BIN44]